MSCLEKENNYHFMNIRPVVDDKRRYLISYGREVPDHGISDSDVVFSTKVANLNSMIHSTELC